MTRPFTRSDHLLSQGASRPEPMGVRELLVAQSATLGLSVRAAVSGGQPIANGKNRVGRR